MGGVVALPVWQAAGLLYRGQRHALRAHRPEADQGRLPPQGQQEPGPAGRLCQASGPCL